MTSEHEKLVEDVATAIAEQRCDNVMDEDRASCIATGHCYCLDYAQTAIALIAERTKEKGGYESAMALLAPQGDN